MLRAVPAVALAVVLAGCVTIPSEPPVEADAPVPADPWALPPFELLGSECSIAGFVSVYGMGPGRTLADAWKAADIHEEVGKPIRDSVGMPVTGPIFGNWHMGVTCSSAATSAGDAEDFIFGFVGEVVEPPAWDAGGADLHFLLSGFGFANGSIGDAARASTTADVTHTSYVKIDWKLPKDLPRTAAYVAMLDAEKGLYESWSTLSKYRDVPARTIRLWWQVTADGEKGHGAHHHDSGASLTTFGNEDPVPGEYHPVYWDLAVSGGPQLTTPAVDGVELASHNMFAFEHGPVAGQPCVTMVYENANVALSPATVVRDVTLGLLWTH